MWVVLIICVTIVTICALAMGFDAGVGRSYELKQKKLEEEHKTANLALAYQILSTRPELSIDEVKQLISFSQNPTKIERANDPVKINSSNDSLNYETNQDTINL